MGARPYRVQSTFCMAQTTVSRTPVSREGCPVGKKKHFAKGAQGARRRNLVDGQDKY